MAVLVHDEGFFLRLAHPGGAHPADHYVFGAVADLADTKELVTGMRDLVGARATHSPGEPISCVYPISTTEPPSSLEQDGAAKFLDIADASERRWGPGLPEVFEYWAEVTAWPAALDVLADWLVPVDRSRLGAPSPAPRQVFAVGLNYHAHAAESGFAAPTQLPPVFTKYVSSFLGPDTGGCAAPAGNVDWEVELVAVVGREAREVARSRCWSYVAGLTAGQDLSERLTQLRGPAPQFGLGKSFHGFSPQGRGW